MKRIASIILCVLITFSFSLAAPVSVLAEDTGTSTVAQFVADNHVLMTRADGRFIGWGDNTYGQLGLGVNGEDSYTTPVEITFFKGKAKIKQIAAIKDTSFVLLNNGELYSTGSGTNGKHGQGDTYDKQEWGRVGGTLTFKKLYTNGAAEFCLAEDYSGSLYAWGKNSDGQLGVGDTNARTSPTLVKVSANVKELWLGETYVEYIDLDGNLFYWGTNAKGQLGLSSAYTKTTHTQTRYSTGVAENKKSTNEVAVLNPDIEYEPTEFTLVSEAEVLGWATPEPAAPAYGPANYTPLKYSVTRSSGSGTSPGGIGIGLYKDKYESASTPIPAYLKCNNGGDFNAITVGLGTDANTSLTGSNSEMWYIYWSIALATTYTSKEWYTGQTIDYAATASFRDARTGSVITNPSVPFKAYLFKVSVPNTYGLTPTQISLAVGEDSYNTIMNNQGASMEQEWYDYVWQNRTLFNTVKSTITNIMEGGNHALALINGKIYGWGDAVKKQLSSIAQSPYPVELPAVNTLITNQKAAGVNLSNVFVDRNSNYLTFDDGSVWVWGDNSYNKSGVDGAAVNIGSPEKVTALQDKKVVKVVAGRDTNYYITDTGDIYVSGSNLNGVSGLGTAHKDEATIETPTKIENIGFSETLEPPTAPAQITVPEKAEEEATIAVAWNAVPNAAKYELKRTVTLRTGTTQTTSAASPLLVYDGTQTTYSDTAKPQWEQVTYELQAKNSIGDYSAPVISSAVPITLKGTVNPPGGDDDGGDTPGGGSVVQPPVNVTVNPPDITVQSPDIRITTPDIKLPNYPEIKYNSDSQAAAAPSDTSSQTWLPTPAQLQALGLSGTNTGYSNAPYVITIQPSAPQYIQPSSDGNSNNTAMYVIIFVLISVIIAIVAFTFASMIFNKNSGELHRIRFMLSELFDSND